MKAERITKKILDAKNNNKLYINGVKASGVDFIDLLIYINKNNYSILESDSKLDILTD